MYLYFLCIFVSHAKKKMVRNCFLCTQNNHGIVELFNLFYFIWIIIFKMHLFRLLKVWTWLKYGLIAAGRHVLDSCLTDGWFQASGGNVTQTRRINSWPKRKRTFQFNLATPEQLEELPSELNTGLSAREREGIFME